LRKTAGPESYKPPRDLTPAYAKDATAVAAILRDLMRRREAEYAARRPFLAAKITRRRRRPK
jgi:hypothetical protein